MKRLRWESLRYIDNQLTSRQKVKGERTNTVVRTLFAFRLTTMDTNENQTFFDGPNGENTKFVVGVLDVGVVRSRTSRMRKFVFPVCTPTLPPRSCSDVRRRIHTTNCSPSVLCTWYRVSCIFAPTTAKTLRSTYAL